MKIIFFMLILTGIILFLYSNKAPTNQKTMTNPVTSNLPERDKLPLEYQNQVPVYAYYFLGIKKNAANAMAIFEDGLIWRYSNKKRYKKEGKIIREEAPFAWRKEAKMKSEGVTEISRALQNLGTFTNEKDSAKQNYYIYYNLENKLISIAQNELNVDNELVQLNNNINSIIAQHTIFQGVPNDQR